MFVKCNNDHYHIIIIFRPWYFIPRVWDIKQSVWCLERLQWGLGNCESVRQADCVESLDCRGDSLVQECRFTRVGGAQRCSPANLGDKLVCLVCQFSSIVHFLSRHKIAVFSWIGPTCKSSNSIGSTCCWFCCCIQQTRSEFEPEVKQLD